jgi:type IV secretory pathway VirJ component
MRPGIRLGCIASFAVLAAFFLAASLAALPTSRQPRRPLAALPLVEVPSTVPGRDELAILLTGDGGWAETDRGLSAALAKGGIPVVGWNSLRYFLRTKTPDVAARDLELILRGYLARWHKEKAVLIGYSFGADVIPVLANRLPRDLADRVSLIVLLGPTGKADFHFHVTGLLGKEAKDSLPSLPEIERLRGKPLLCVQGIGEQHSFCPQIPPGLAVRLIRPGGHIVNQNYGPVAAWILGPREASH